MGKVSDMQGYLSGRRFSPTASKPCVQKPAPRRAALPLRWASRNGGRPRAAAGPRGEFDSKRGLCHCYRFRGARSGVASASGCLPPAARGTPSRYRPGRVLPNYNARAARPCPSQQSLTVALGCSWVQVGDQCSLSAGCCCYPKLDILRLLRCRLTREKVELGTDQKVALHACEDGRRSPP